MGATFFYFTTFRITRTRFRKYLTTNLTARNTPFIIPYAISIIISFIISITPFTVTVFTIISVIITVAATIITSFTTIATTTITSFIITVAFTTIAQEHIIITTCAVIMLKSVIILGAPSSRLAFAGSLGALAVLRRRVGSGAR